MTFVVLQKKSKSKCLQSMKFLVMGMVYILDFPEHCRTIAALPKEVEAGMKVAEVCRKYGISDATYYNWKAKFGGMTVSDAQRLKALEAENGKLKRLLAETRQCDAERCRRAKVVSPQARRAAVTHLMTAHPLDVTRACGLIGISRSLYRYESTRPDDTALTERLTTLAEQKRRYG